MKGRVQWYDLASQRGRLTTSAGRSLPFRLAESVGNIQGGDIVGFRVQSDGGQVQAVGLRIIQTCVDYLNDQERGLVNQFHSTVAIQP